MPPVLRRKHIDANVYDEALNRIRNLYDQFDEIVVLFSGGKDSTALLYLTKIIAKEKGRLPLKVNFYDEEAIHPPTIEYVARVSEDPDLNFRWFCVPLKHRNACSSSSPWWYVWNPEKQNLWVRDLPPKAITEWPGFFKGLSTESFSHLTVPYSNKRTAFLMGIRTQESIRRLRIVSRRREDNYISKIFRRVQIEHYNDPKLIAEFRHKVTDRKAQVSNRFVYFASNACHAYPIYDWSSVDVWRLVYEKKIDYNRTYDCYQKTKIANKLLSQRVAPPFGEQPLQGLYLYAQLWPEIWHKMLNRVPGVATAWRYAKTELYSVRQKPESLTWQEYAKFIVEHQYEGKTQIKVEENVNQLINWHYSQTTDELHGVKAHPLTGASWKFICMVAIKGDLKGRYKGAMHLDAEDNPEFKKLRARWDQGDFGNLKFKDCCIAKWGRKDFQKETFGKNYHKIRAKFLKLEKAKL